MLYQFCKQKNTEQKKVITLNKQLHEHKKIRKVMRTRTALSLVNEK